MNNLAKLNLLKKLVPLVQPHFDDDGTVGQDFAYLTAAILNGTVCYWPANRPILLFLPGKRGALAAVWDFINVEGAACQRCGSALIGGFCQDETCPFSDHVQACPSGWNGHPSRSDMACLCGDHIIATFVPQRVFDNDESEWVRFDVTEAIRKMTQRQACEINDDQYESDDLIPAEIRDKHNGPFRVIVEDAIAAWLKKNK